MTEITGHKCANCGERIDVARVDHPFFGEYAWVHDRTGQCACRDDLGDWKRGQAPGEAFLDVPVAAPAS